MLGTELAVWHPGGGRAHLRHDRTGQSAMQYFMPGSFPSVGDYWTIIGSASFTIGHLAMILTCAGQVYALRTGYRNPGRISRAVAHRHA